MDDSRPVRSVGFKSTKSSYKPEFGVVDVISLDNSEEDAPHSLNKNTLPQIKILDEDPEIKGDYDDEKLLLSDVDFENFRDNIVS